jgi:hypothetical protein
MDIQNQSCIPVELRVALYRRVLACAYIEACEHYGLELTLTLDELESAIANEIEKQYVVAHGFDQGVELACEMLGDMVYPDFLDMPPCLTPLGEQIMDTVCQKNIGICKHDSALILH